tara:strand:+ start:357 stop:995 length:639 start_codon:yes stop_codon:yes gene_type:complete
MMSWEQLLKTDPCTLEAKEILYQVLEKMGANNDLLESLRTHDDDDIREMLEDFARTSPQKDVFKALLRNWDMCIVETRKNPNTPQVEMDSSDMYKILKGGKTTDRQSLKDAITVTTEKLNYESNARLLYGDRKQETAIFVKTDDRFYDTLREEYIKHYMENMQVERRYIGSVKNHAKAKIQPISIRSMVGKYLRTLGYEYMTGNDRLWRKIK